MKSRFGLHVRLKTSLLDAVEKMQRLQHAFFQTILILPAKKSLTVTESEIEQFIEFQQQYCQQVFVHATYWSNLIDVASRGFQSLIQEVQLAERLHCSHVIIHPGSFTQDLTRQQRVDRIAHAVQMLLAQSNNIIILLENSPHKDKSFSASIEEFGALFKRLQYHPRVKMCVDTAHAYVAGYDISDERKVDVFIKNLLQQVGAEQIGLIHCNDTKKKCGSFIDEHAVPDHGNIGMAALYHFVHHEQLKAVPVILELPTIDESLEIDIIEQFENMEKL